MNRFVWNLRLPAAKAVPDSVIWFGSMAGPKVPPGTYTVTLEVDGKSYSRRFKVAKDPRTSATQADLDAQFALLSRIHSKLDAVDKAVLRIRKLRKQIQGYQTRLAAGSTAAKSARNILARLTDIEQTLMQTKSHASEDPLNHPVRLRSKLATLAFATGAAPGRPTREEKLVWQKLSARADRQLEALAKVSGQGVPALNRLIQQANLPPVSVPPAATAMP